MDWPFGDLPRNHYGAILADPPWKFEHWGKDTISGRDPENHYPLMTSEQLLALPVRDLAAEHCVLFLWITWPLLELSLRVIPAWGFTYKTCAFAWMKADVSTVNMFEGPVDADMLLGYWTRANSEVCLLATSGKPQRLDAGVRQGIIAPRREHSRKPDGVHERIQRLVAGPYVELFARAERPGWDCWGNETKKFNTKGVTDETRQEPERPR